MRIIRRSSLLSLILCLISLICIFRFLNTKPLLGTPTTTPLHHHDPIFDTSTFNPSILKPPGANYTRILVMGRTSSESVAWVHESLPNLPTAIYTVDSNITTDPVNASIPANKGHEAMVYLTYIIDYYPNFPDVVLFFHPTRIAWHNNIMHDVDTAITIQRIRDEHVIRQGYFNTRCHLNPGCPRWLKVDCWWPYWDRVKKPEEPYLTEEVWRALHGVDTRAGREVDVPDFISQPCCAQFAVSGQRILERSKEEYVRYRTWVLESELDDATTGRLLEYSWQWIFAGKWEYCPSMNWCYCEGYGICFGESEGEAEDGLREWLKILKKREAVDEKRKSMWDRGDRKSVKYKRLTLQSDGYSAELDRRREIAEERGRLKQKREWDERRGVIGIR